MEEYEPSQLQTNKQTALNRPFKFTLMQALRQNKQQGIRICKDNKLVRNASDYDRWLLSLYMPNNFIQIRWLGKLVHVSHLG